MMSELNHNKVDEWSFLKQVYDLLLEENVLHTPAEKPVVDFKFPDELRVSDVFCIYKWKRLKQISINVLT